MNTIDGNRAFTIEVLPTSILPIKAFHKVNSNRGITDFVIGFSSPPPLIGRISPINEQFKILIIVAGNVHTDNLFFLFIR